MMQASDVEYHYCRQMKIFVVQSELNCCQRYKRLCLNVSSSHVQDVTKVAQEVLQSSPFTPFLRPCWNSLMNKVAIYQFELLDLSNIDSNTTLLSSIRTFKLSLPRKRRHIITQYSIWNVIMYVSLILLYTGSAKWYSCSFDQLQVRAICVQFVIAPKLLNCCYYQCYVFPHNLQSYGMGEQE